MAVYTMKYGESVCAVPVDPAHVAAELRPNAVALPQLPPEEVLRRALARPIGSPPLGEIVRPGQTVCLVIPDITRLWQSPSIYVPAMVAELNRCGIPDSDILLLSATGTHRRQSEEEHIRLVSEEIFRRIRIVDHACRDAQDMRHVGDTSRGTPVWLNRHALDCDKIILCCGVVYHFLAGYGGGGKMLLPGIASYETIQRHHNLALNKGFGSGSNPLVRSANLTESNPFHADLMEGAALAKPCFSLNVVVNDDFEIVQAFAGDWVEAHQAACALVDAVDGVAVRERTPLVIASAGGYPKDLNFYQSIKTLSNALAAVSPGGTMILLSRCSEGFGNAECQRQICQLNTMREREEFLRGQFSIGGYVGFLFAESAEKHNLILVTDMAPENFARTKIHAVPSLKAALDLARDLLGGTLAVRTTLMPHGASTLPKLS